MQREDFKYVRERCSLGLKWIYSIGKVGERNILEQVITSLLLVKAQALRDNTFIKEFGEEVDSHYSRSKGKSGVFENIPE